MKTISITVCVAALMLTACNTPRALQKEKQLTKKQSIMKNKSNKEKVLELLGSFENGNEHALSYIRDDYKQHNPYVSDGKKGLVEFVSSLPPGSVKAKVVRIFEDGDYVIAHSEYEFSGPKVAFDIFRFEDGMIVEHWDNFQEKVDKTASGRAQTGGASEVTDRHLTAGNKELVGDFILDVLLGKNPSKITSYISTGQYLQHNPYVKDGLDGLGEALKSLEEAGMPMIYEKNHMLLGEGNFVLAVSEGKFMNNHVAFYDLFRVENGKIVEHWDVIEEIPGKNLWKNSNGKF